MAGEENEKREAAIIDLFVSRCPGHRLSVVSLQDKPDGILRCEDTGRLIGLEVTELLRPDDGKDRALEKALHDGITKACRDVLGPSGYVSAVVCERPSLVDSVHSWLLAFRQWLYRNRGDILSGRSPVFPESSAWSVAKWSALRRMRADRSDLREALLEGRTQRSLEWAEVRSICAVQRRSSGWSVSAAPGHDHFAGRVSADWDDCIVSRVRSKIEKAPGYRANGSLWLLLRSARTQSESVGLVGRLRELPGIDIFEAVWIVDCPANVFDAANPPEVRLIFGDLRDEGHS